MAYFFDCSCNLMGYFLCHILEQVLGVDQVHQRLGFLTQTVKEINILVVKLEVECFYFNFDLR
jgi:hypothetical protein